MEWSGSGVQSHSGQGCMQNCTVVLMIPAIPGGAGDQDIYDRLMDGMDQQRFADGNVQIK